VKLLGIGGFPLPFAVVGGVLLVLLPFLVYVLRHSDIEHDPTKEDVKDPDASDAAAAVASSTEQSTKISVAADPAIEGEVTWLKALSQIDVLLSCLLLFMGQVSLGMLWPTLSVELEDHLGLEGREAIIGFIYAIPALCYACSAYFAGTAADRIGTTRMQLMGALAVGLSYCLIGPIHPIAVWIGDSSAVEWTTKVLGLVILGIGYCGVSVPSFPAVINALAIFGTSGKDLASALLNAASSIGEGTGPLVGGALHDLIGFQGIALFATGCFAGWLAVALVRYSVFRNVRTCCGN